MINVRDLQEMWTVEEWAMWRRYCLQKNVQPKMMDYYDEVDVYEFQLILELGDTSKIEPPKIEGPLGDRLPDGSINMKGTEQDG